MIPCRIYSTDTDVDTRLVPFGVTRQSLVQIVRAVVAARADAVADDPVTAEGLFAYIYGTRALRQIFGMSGWVRHRHENIESVRHPQHSMKVVYQSVDLAAAPGHVPQAVSGKGAGANRSVSASQGNLFAPPTQGVPALVPVRAIVAGTWFFCVSVDGDDVRAELSLPSKITDGNFESFIERIYIVRDGEWASISVIDAAGPDAVEFEPLVTRK